MSPQTIANYKYFFVVLFGVFFTSSAKYSDFEALYNKFKPICGVPEINHVVARADGKVLFPETEFIKSGKWSLSESAFHQVFKEHHEKIHPCNNASELATSFANNIDDATCSIEWLSNTEICSILSQFSLTFFVGDSLTRHMSNALYMLLTNNLQYGAFPRTDPLSMPKELVPCSCDGQFSESLFCRLYSEGDFTFTDNKIQGEGDVVFVYL